MGGGGGRGDLFERHVTQTREAFQSSLHYSTGEMENSPPPALWGDRILLSPPGGMSNPPPPQGRYTNHAISTTCERGYEAVAVVV